ncbi:molybdopterin cofactor-binding domain-containing protein [Nitratireductor sp. ZSWI3]|uniref:xanthine dehydrogenase family protein molybdopterin-binding subunit n=1 Tax=Nitratireductor sp. ZSWI3 TaxID=2966359 RepID=UPI0021505B8E|nr:molybdopterin cofactor-binding domain-containing protein [Nitratireductor sp. ZSWI3]MCR4267269.1 molybdopterin-dependent oxidoreductase [Nitratireductor sp. ZSWI3]
MNTIVNLSRRTFLATSATAAASLVLGLTVPTPTFAEDEGEPSAINAFVSLSDDGTTTILLNKSEMGQGIFTGIAMLVADELDADWARVRVRSITDPHREDYWTPSYAGVGTGGSRSIRESWMDFRRAGAAARDMLVTAAAQRLEVPKDRLRTENGYVIDEENGIRLDYGELASLAAEQEPPAEPTLKDADRWKLIGHAIEQLDIPLKVNGSAVYGIDVRLSDMLVATAMQSPVPGGTVADVDDARARAMPGVAAIVRDEGFVAVVAETYWQARQGLEALQVTWSAPELVDENTQAMMDRFAAALDGELIAAEGEGDTAAALSSSGRVIEAEYQVPMIAHACMEPLNCTALVEADACTIWGPLQTPGWAQGVGAGVAGVPIENVVVNTTFLGGGFGRKFLVDFVAQAVLIAKAVPGRPVKTVWSREEDFAQGFFRPAALHRIRAGLDNDGALAVWEHRLAQPSILHRWLPEGGAMQTPLERVAAESLPGPMLEARQRSVKEIDPTIPESIASKTYYAIGARSLKLAMPPSSLPVGIWRSVGSSGNAFVFESMVDELAHAAGEDPFRFRRRLLEASPRHLAVLDRAAELAGWEKPAAEGRFRGIALDACFGSIAAHVAEVSVSEEGLPRVHRVTAVLDCGVVVNRRAALAQIEGAVMQGVSAALAEAITLEEGRVVETNFDRYRVLTLAEAPVVEAHLLESGEAPGGVGEPALPPVAPAVCNAIFAATGVRVRSLPISQHDLRRV